MTGSSLILFFHSTLPTLEKTVGERVISRALYGNGGKHLDVTYPEICQVEVFAAIRSRCVPGKP